MTTFTVEGQPVPKARARLARHGHAYTPRRTKEYEELVGWRYKEAGGPVHDGPVAVRAEFLRYGNVLADLDNLLKAVLDGLNGVAYHDDHQVHYLEASILYMCDEPQAVVTVETID